MYMLQDLKSKPHDFHWSVLPIKIKSGWPYVITGDYKSINNASLQDVLDKGLKTEPKSINWKLEIIILNGRSQLTQIKIKNNNNESMSTCATLICNDLNTYLNDKCAVVSANKAPNNIVTVSSIQAIKQTLQDYENYSLV